MWINKLELKTIIKDIEFIKQKCDFIIVSLHWGIENVFYPSPRQIEFAHELIGAGAAIILGYHPHVIKGIERYKHGLIVYSLGNFQFEPSVSKSPNNQSFIISIELTKEGLEDYEIIPILVNEDFVSVLAKRSDRKNILDFINIISQPLMRGEITESMWFKEIANMYLSGNIKSWIIRIKKYGIKHFLQCIRWLISPFVIRCYIGFLSKKFKGH